MKKDNETSKATDKFNADALEAIAAAGEWRLKKGRTACQGRRRIPGRCAGRWVIALHRLARKVGLVAYRCRTQHLGNLDQFQVVDPKRGNMVVAGQCFDMTALDVIKLCERRSTRKEGGSLNAH
jgi:hypothetical protein